MIVQDHLRGAAASIGRHGLQSYSTYRKVELSWLNEIPEHWKLPRLGFITELNPTKQEVRGEPDDKVVSFVPMESVGEWGGLDLSSERAIADVVDGYTYFANDDVLVAKITPCFENGKGALATGLKSGLGFGTTELHVLRPTDAIDAAFLLYLSVSHHFRSLGEASMYGAAGQKRVPEEYVFSFRHPLPPLAEQRAIARFLNEATRRIDKLIAKKERLIELLEEKRTALITQAVTKGLDPDVPMKDCGVEWIGKIPEHWETPRLGMITKVRCDGPFGSKITSGHYRSEGARVVRLQNIGWAEFKGNDSAYIDADYFRDELRSHEVKPGDVLIAGLGDDRNPVGRACVAPADLGPALVKADCFRFRVNGSYLLPSFAAYQLSATAEAAGTAWATGATRLRMNLGITENRRLALPPRREQGRIVSHIDEKSVELGRLLDNVRQAQTLLREYRSALITAAVTGKIDVRDHAA